MTAPIRIDATERARESAPASACPACGSRDLSVFYEQDRVPVHSCRLVPTLDEALRFPRGSLRLAFCAGCGFIFNDAFDGSVQDYGVAYEETQGFSPAFRAFARGLAERWIDRYDLRGKTLLEIGCGKGEFLELVCELGDNAGIGIDPALVEERLDDAAGRGITPLPELYEERHCALAADAVLCRHTLEHIAEVADFLGLIRRSLAARLDTPVLFDLPDVVRVLREPAFWDVYYEHASYFSPGSLGRLFRRAGFEILDLTRDYDDQYLVLEAKPTNWPQNVPHPLEESLGELWEDAQRFSRAVAETAERWRTFLTRARAAGQRVAVWGAGSKAVAFLTTVAADGDVAFAVDVNPYKQGMFLAGTGHRVVGPDDLPAEPPDVVVAMNAVYVDEIRAALAARKVGADVLST